MPPEDYQRACDIFAALQDVPDDQLAAAIEKSCADNAAIREEVLRLIQGDRAAGSFLQTSAMADAARLLPAAAVKPPAAIGHYRILAKLGEGGMGEVWRAQDSKLGREVAIKTLPAAFAADGDRVARFQREAQVLASLNHPNIAAIYGVEEGALVMELVDGPTLAERIAKGPLPWEEAAEIAVQIAAGLEGAHEKGVVHRDLKPANVKITIEGQVKVLDFGLARLLSNEPISGDPPGVAAVTVHSSMAGVIPGTAAYMAPEQVKGQRAGRQADVWAFGVVLYQMLTGRNPLARETAGETLAAVLDMEWDRTKVPAISGPILERCLRKDPRRRWQSMGDVRIAIEEALAGGQAEPVAAPRRSRFAWASIGAVAAGIAILAILILRPGKIPAALQFTVTSPENGLFALASVLRVSPNGEYVLFVAANPTDLLWRAYLYNVAQGTTRLLPGTERTADAEWSPDSASLLLNRGDALSRIDLDSNILQPLPFEAGEVAWSGREIIAATREGLQSFHPDGAGARLLVASGGANGTFLLRPEIIPGSRWFLYSAWDGTPSSGVSVKLASMDGKRQRPLMHAERAAVYGAPGYALFLRGAMLMAQAFDSSNGQVRGDALPVAGPVERPLGSVGSGTFSASNNGVLAYRRSSAADFRMVWFDRSGKRVGTIGDVADYSNPALSPDGTRLAVSVRDPSTGNRDIRVYDLARGTPTRITFDPSDHNGAVWSSDGTRIAYSGDRGGARDIYIKAASGVGSEELVIASKTPKNVEDWTQDGRWMVYNEAVPHNGDDLAVIDLAARQPRDFLRTQFQEDRGRFSPDGKWIAYQSDESGRGEVYIQPFPPTGQKWQISNDHGGGPQWRGDGKELYYSTLSFPAAMMAVDIGVRGNAIHAGLPHKLFDVVLQDSGARNRWSVSKDGRRFLAIVPTNEEEVHRFTVVLNWPSLLKAGKP